MKHPTQRALTQCLKELHDADFGEYVSLCWVNARTSTWHSHNVWILTSDPNMHSLLSHPIGREYIPGNTEPFDASAAARRLMSDYRSWASKQTWYK